LLLCLDVHRQRDHSAENSLLDEYAPNQPENEEPVQLKDKSTTQRSELLIRDLEIKLPHGLNLT